MLLQPTIEKLHRLKLYGMAQALRDQDNHEYQTLSFEDRLAMLLDREENVQESRRLEARLRQAKLRQSATPEDVDLRTTRGLNKSLFLSLSECTWIKQHQNVLIAGPTGVGKSYLACALGHKACRMGFSVQYHRTGKLLHELGVARGDGRYLRLLKSLMRVDVLILDDWGLEPFTKDQRHDLLEIIEDRHDRKSLIVTSQIPVDGWHTLIEDPTLADAIMDRIAHNSHMINLKGESMRKRNALKTQTLSET